MSKFEHFLITRFNLQKFHRSFNPDNEKWIAWIKRRFTIFQNYCLPSVANQTNKNFRWLIYFDTMTPPEIDNYINELRQYDFIEICYANGSEDFFIKYLSDIQEKIKKETEWIITSRLDNDDCLHSSVIDRIQNEFIPSDKYMISFALGYVYDTEIQKLSQYYYLKSPFISLIEKKDSLLGIYHKNHNRWDTMQVSIFKELYYLCMNKKVKRTACFILDNTLWMQVCHGENLGNNFYRGRPVLYSKKLNDFGIDRVALASRGIDYFKYINLKIWWRCLYAIIFKKLLKS